MALRYGSVATRVCRVCDRCHVNNVLIQSTSLAATVCANCNSPATTVLKYPSTVPQGAGYHPSARFLPLKGHIGEYHSSVHFLSLTNDSTAQVYHSSACPLTLTTALLKDITEVLVATIITQVLTHIRSPNHSSARTAQGYHSSAHFIRRFSNSPSSAQPHCQRYRAAW